MIGISTALMALCVACSSGSESTDGGGPEQVLVRTGATVEAYDVPMLHAEALGYFEDEGLDVDIKQGAGSAGTVKVVGTKKADIGVVDLATMASGVAEGVEVKGIAGVFQNTPLSTIYLKSSGFTSPDDLKGKTVGNAPDSAGSTFMPAWRSAVGLEESDFKEVLTGLGSLQQALVSGRVDSYVSYAVYEVPKLNHSLGAEADAFDWGDELDMIGLGLIANDETISENPEMLKKFLRAYAKGYTAAAADPQAGCKSVLDAFPQAAGASAATCEEGWIRAQQLQFSDATERQPLLWMAPETWESTLETMAEYTGLDTDKPATDFYTNDLVDDVEKPARPDLP